MNHKSVNDVEHRSSVVPAPLVERQKLHGGTQNTEMKINK